MTLKKAPYAFGLLLVMLADVAVAGLNEAPRESDQPTTPAEKKASAGLQTAQSLITATSEEALLTVRGHKASSTRILARVSMLPGRASAADQVLDEQGLTVTTRYDLVPGLVLLTAKSSRTGGMTTPELEEIIAELKASGEFDYVEPDWQVQALQTPSDSAFADGTLWGLRNTGQDGGQTGIDINVVPAWSSTTGSASVVVGVVDTGVRYTHQDLASNMWTNPNEIPGNGIDDDNNGYIDDVYGINAINNSGDPNDDNDHGTHVAGTIAASGNDAGELVGVAFTSKIMALKFLGSSGGGNVSDAIQCIDYAVANGADILNNSWGGGGFSTPLSESIEAANSAGVLFVAAAGNSSSNNDSSPHYPSSYEADNVIAVAAIDRSGNRASFSSYGATSVDIGAPGVAIHSSTASSDTSYASFRGTSMATPHVAGVAALVLSQYPSASISELKARLLSTAAPLASLSGRVVTGGMVDTTAALNLTEDGNLELSVIAPTLRAGQTAAIGITVTDLTPVLNATVSGSLSGASSVQFLDNGVAPDETNGDGIYTGEITAPATGNSTTLTVSASAPGKTSAQQDFQLAVISPPANDDFADRITLTPGSTSTTGSNREATPETGEPRPFSFTTGSSVWWSWTPDREISNATITTIGSDYDTTLAVYTGSSVTNLSLLAANDDISYATYRQSRVYVNAQQGVTYHIHVDGWRRDEGDIQLNYPDPGSIPNAYPPTISQQPASRSVFEGSPLELSVIADGSPAPTYQWMRIDESGTSTAIPGATQATYRVESAAAGDEGSYAVSVSNYLGTVTSQTVYVSVARVFTRPVNDDFASRSSLSGSDGRVAGANVDATGESGEPNHAGVGAPTQSVWYQWQAPESGTATFDTLGSDFDTVLGVYTGTQVNALTLVASNDDAGSIVQSAVTFSVTNGTVYQIAVDGLGDRTGQYALNYVLTPLPPANDNFSARRDLGSSAQVTDTGTNISASGEGGEPNHAGRSTPIASSWWSWTAPGDGRAFIDTSGSDYDTTLAVYTGSNVNSLTLLSADDDSSVGLTSRVSFDTSPYQDFAIAVDGYAAAQGDISLAVDFQPDGVPGAPQNVTASAGDGYADVNWDAPDYDGGSLITQYTVSASPGGLQCSVTPPRRQCAIQGLTNGTAYTFVVTANNASGTGATSAPSAAVTPTGVPSAPLNISASAGDGSAQVSWSASASDGGRAITQYRVWSVQDSLKQCTPQNLSDLNCTVSGLANGSTYTFHARAYNNIGAGPYSSASNAVTPTGIPGSPTGVSAVASCDNTAVITWSAPGSDGGSPITAFNVTSAQNASLTCSTGGSGRSCSIPGLTEGQNYSFRVTATNALGTSAAATTSSITPKNTDSDSDGLCDGEDPFPNAVTERTADGLTLSIAPSSALSQCSISMLARQSVPTSAGGFISGSGHSAYFAVSDCGSDSPLPVTLNMGSYHSGHAAFAVKQDNNWLRVPGARKSRSVVSFDFVDNGLIDKDNSSGYLKASITTALGVEAVLLVLNGSRSLEEEERDTDGDGFLDDVDQCPETPGDEPTGCPTFQFLSWRTLATNDTGGYFEPIGDSGCYRSPGTSYFTRSYRTNNIGINNSYAEAVLRVRNNSAYIAGDVDSEYGDYGRVVVNGREVWGAEGPYEYNVNFSLGLNDGDVVSLRYTKDSSGSYGYDQMIFGLFGGTVCGGIGLRSALEGTVSPDTTKETRDEPQFGSP